MADNGPADVTPPDLAEPSVTGPTVDGTPREGDGPPPRDPRGRRGKGVPQTVTPPPTHQAYAVSPGSVNDAGNEILGRAQTSVGMYQDLKSTVQETSGWIFWERKPFDSITDPLTGGTEYETDQNPELTNQMAAAQDNLLLEIGDSITLAGEFADQLNNAAQFYTRADKSSVLPELAEMGTMAQAPSPGGAGPGIPSGSPTGGGVKGAEETPAE